MLANTLARSDKFVLNEKASKRAVGVFTKSSEYAGLIVNGVLKENVESSQSQEKSLSNYSEVSEEDNKSSHAEPDNDENATASSHTSQSITSPDKILYLEPRTLPSGIKIVFPQKLESELLFGEFGKVLKELDSIATSLLQKQE